MVSEIAIAVVEYENHFLVGKRPEGVPLAGLWEFPGGKMEPGEAADEAAARECLEETGIAVETIGQLPDQLESYSHGTVRLFFVHCLPKQPIPPPRPPYRWVPRAQLAELPFPSGNRRVIDLLLSRSR